MNTWQTKIAVSCVLTLVLLGIGCAQRSVEADLPVASPSTVSTVALAMARQPATYYIRTDGGNPDECTGLANVPYPGSGTGHDCAWDHPFRALPPGDTPRIAGGDTLIVGSGSYVMGLDAPGADNEDVCDAEWAYDCHMPPIPSGLNPENPTRILGAGWDAGCPSPPELWGSERLSFIVNLTDSSDAEVACFEITDHSECVEDHTGGLACTRDSPPYGDWAALGLYAEDSARVHLRDLDIHGLAVGGIKAGRIADWTVERVRLAGNGWVGWEGDIDGDDSNSGTLTFRHWTVEWNGCGETYPGGEPVGCWAQTAGGYGDGIGTGRTGGHWIIEDSTFSHNTSDGLDLLYTHEGGSRVEIRRTIARGNAGDQIKVTGPAYLENVVSISDCGFFEGQAFTYDVDNCRSGGSALALYPRAGDRITVVNSTLAGEGDCLVIAECGYESECDRSESILLRNSIFQGGPEFGGEDTTCLAWHGSSLADGLFEIEYSIINGAKAVPDPCPPHSQCDVDPGLVSIALDSFDAHLASGSPAIDTGTTDGAPTDDFERQPRDAAPDIGADEWREPVAWIYLPLAALERERTSALLAQASPVFLLR